MIIDTCPICLNKLLQIVPGATLSIECPCCGKYKITDTALAVPPQFTERQRANVSGWLLANPNFTISTANFDFLLAIRTPTFHSRADKLLLTLEKETEYAGQFLEIKFSWFGSSWTNNKNELLELISYLETSGRIYKQTGAKILYKITPNGWERLEKLKEFNPTSNQCFVAMWFDDKMKQIYDEAFVKGIEAAGYKSHRVDQRQYNDKIDDEIMAQIRRSRFIVSDFTGHRGGVYYEAGFARGLGLQVIFTCRKDEIDKLHFDVRQYNCIDWAEDHLPDFIRRLTNRIESVFGHGSYRP
jgi:DNA-binding PadR family transcriptional regulator